MLDESQKIASPFEWVAVDLVCPLAWVKKRNSFILTLVDTMCSRAGEAITLRAINFIQVVEALVMIFTCLGFPNHILTDNGSQFRETLTEEVFCSFQTRHIHTTLNRTDL